MKMEWLRAGDSAPACWACFLIFDDHVDVLAVIGPNERTMQSPCRHCKNSRKRRSMSYCSTFGPLLAMMNGSGIVNFVGANPAQGNERRDAQRGSAKEYSALGKILAG